MNTQGKPIDHWAEYNFLRDKPFAYFENRVSETSYQEYKCAGSLEQNLDLFNYTYNEEHFNKSTACHRTDDRNKSACRRFDVVRIPLKIFVFMRLIRICFISFPFP